MIHAHTYRLKSITGNHRQSHEISCLYYCLYYVTGPGMIGGLKSQET